MSGTVSYDLFTSRLGSGNNIGFTPEGGLYLTLVNNTGLSVKGTIVIASATVDNGVDIAPASSQMPIGVIYESGVANGSLVKVVVYGKAEVLLRDGESATNGYWAGTSVDSGRMYQAAIPSLLPGQQIGNSLEDKASGTDVLSYVFVHLY